MLSVSLTVPTGNWYKWQEKCLFQHVASLLPDVPHSASPAGAPDSPAHIPTIQKEKIKQELHFDQNKIQKRWVESFGQQIRSSTVQQYGLVVIPLQSKPKKEVKLNNRPIWRIYHHQLYIIMQPFTPETSDLVWLLPFTMGCFFFFFQNKVL